MFATSFVVFLIVIRASSCDLAFDYYHNLVAENVEAGSNYQPPTSSEEFKNGARSSKIIEFGNFDFIIIGAGAAGSVLATRLSEVSDWKILLLETGDEETDFSKIPGYMPVLQLSNMNWGYKTTPQTGCCQGMKEKRCEVPRGKAIGGSSSINGMMYIRGNSEDFDKWERLGNPGWSYKNVLPYFIKSENSQVDGDRGYHNQGGLLNVQYSPFQSFYYDYFFEANKELNRSLVDINGRQQIGFSKLPTNIKRSKRQSTGTAFLDGARRRSNLKVLTRTLVTQLIIDTTSREARGVIFVRNNIKFKANANLEVLLSAGAFNSPQLLMLSGIGPKSHLKKLGIDVIEDLPVGQQLIDHPLFVGLTFRTNHTFTQTSDEWLKEYLQNTGRLTMAAGNEAVGFLNGGNLPATVPIIEYLFIPPPSSSKTVVQSMNFDDEVITYFNQSNPNTDIVFYLILLHEKSRGSVTLKSTDPTDFPNIDFNLLDQPEDIDNFIEGINFILKLGQTKAFQKLNATFLELPLCRQFRTYSREYWECALRKMTSTIFHGCGTTPMGPNPKTAVVDHKLRVHGIKKLRVVDAGVMPSSISGHTAAATVMIAEKIADLIKLNYGFGL